jgi:hypothetical protein
VKIFLDECIDWRLSRDIEGHDVKTARQMGWTSNKNGELFSLASEQFDVFATVDRNLSFQQNPGSFSVAVIVLHVRSNRLSDLRLIVRRLLDIIESAPRRTVTIVGES